MAVSVLGHPLPRSAPSLGGFQHGCFSPAFSTAALQGPLHAAWTAPPQTSFLLRRLGGSSASPFPAAALAETQQWLQQSQSGSRTLLWQVPNGATCSAWQSHIPPAPTCCHRSPHRHKTHPTRLGNMRTPLLPHGLRLSLRGSSLSQAGEQHLQPLVSCSSSPWLLLLPRQVGRQEGQCPGLQVTPAPLSQPKGRQKGGGRKRLPMWAHAAPQPSWHDDSDSVTGAGKAGAGGARGDRHTSCASRSPSQCPAPGRVSPEASGRNCSRGAKPKGRVPATASAQGS